MDVFDLFEHRRSVRSFTPGKISPEHLQAVLAAANSAPSAGNLQALEIYVVARRAQKEALAKAAVGQMFIAEAPLVLVFAAHPARSAARYGRRGEQLYAIQDATIACAFAVMAAAALGLGTVWVGAFADQQVRQVLGAPDGITPVAILPIGYAAEDPEPRSRRPLADLVHHI